MQMKFYSPLAADFFPNEPDYEDEFYDEYEGCPLDGHDLLQYADAVDEAVKKDIADFNGDLMQYYHEDDSVRSKVVSAVPSVEICGNKLCGCLTVELKEPLLDDEQTVLCNYISGQYSDGWGEGFEQRDIRVDDGTLAVHFWQEDGFKMTPSFEKIPKPEKNSLRPKMQLIGQDGNVFAIMGRASRLLKNAGQSDKAKEMCDRVTASQSYSEALNIVSEYVETELSPSHTDEAARQLQSTLLGVETNVANWQRRQNANNNFTATVPYDMELQRKETKEMLDDLTTRDQRMMFGLVTLVHLADSKEQLDSDTETLYSTARRHLCQLSTLRWQQKDGLDTVLPYGLRKIQALRTLTTESTAVLIPFRAQEIMQSNGLYYGQNAVSKNMIVADRRLLLNGNSFRLGVSGSGKSMSAKEEIVQIALSTEDDILILDPESEFGYLTEALGGVVIRISATSDTHINALDMDRAYGDERNPIVSKSEFVLSLFEQLIGDGMVTAKEKSILGRCTEQVYLPYIRNGYKGTPPTLQDFYRLLQMQPEPEAQGLALASELFITGTLNTFAQRTNVDTNARIIDYDIRELGEQLMPLGMLVTLDAIYNRVIRNWKSGKTTWIFCDEFYVLFRYEYSANFFYKLWKRIRKYNGLITGLTQNVEELLRSDTARLMLANSEFLVLLNQSATDREELAKLLNISDTQLGYITNVPAGCGLIRCAGSIVPFTNSFPKNTRLYQLMTTKPDEALR